MRSKKTFLAAFLTAILSTLCASAPAARAEGEPARLVAVSPAAGALTDSRALHLEGTVEGAVKVRVDGVPASVENAVGMKRFQAGPFDLPEGTHVFQIALESADGRVVTRAHRLVVDRRPPTIEARAPARGPVADSPYWVEGRVTDPHLDSVMVGDVRATLEGRVFRAPVTLAEGRHQIEITASDRLGHVSRKTIEVEIDRQPPTLAITVDGVPLADGARFRSGIAPTVLAESGAKLIAHLDGRPWTPGSMIKAEGTHRLEIVALDAAGNRAERRIAFVVDRTPPRIASLEEPGAPVRDPDFTVEGRVDQATSVTVEGREAELLDDGRFRSAPIALEPGARELVVEAVDAAGNVATALLPVKSDPNAPDVNVTAPSDGAVVGASPITVTGTADDADLDTVTVAGAAATLDGNGFTRSVSLAEGANDLAVVATDLAGNVTEVTVGVTLDTAAPGLAIEAGGVPLTEGAVFGQSVTPEVVVTDATSVSIQATLDGLAWSPGTTVTSLGQHELSVTATDAAGNAASVLVGFEIEGVPPVITVSSPADQVVTSAASMTLVGRAQGAVALRVDGQSVALEGEDFAAGPYVLSEGARTFVLAADSAGGQTASLDLHVVRDTTAPTLAIAAPADATVTGEATVTVNGTVTDAHLDRVRVNGAVASLSGDTSAGASWSAAVTLAEGDQRLLVVAEDRAGNVRESERTVTLDSRAPEVTITDPASGSVLAGATITVRGAVREPHLDRVEVGRRGAAAVVAQVTGETWSAEVDLIVGEQTLVATGYDTVGNSSPGSGAGAGTEITVTRDDQALGIEITTPTEGTFTRNATVDVSGTVAAEADSVTVNGQSATLAGDGTWSIAGVSLFAGENELIARANATSGSVTQGVHVRKVTLDTESPALIGATPSDGASAIDPAGDLAIRFSEPLATTVADAPSGAWQLRLAGGATLTANGSLEQGLDGESVLRVRPSAALPEQSNIELALTAGIVDRAGNVLDGGPVVLSWSTATGSAPASPTVDPVSPARRCAASVTITGQALADQRVDVTGGAASATTRAAADGSWQLEVSLLSDRLHGLEITAVDRDGRRSAPVWVEVIQDCRPPHVAEASRSGQTLTVIFDESIDAATADATVRDAAGTVAGSVTVGDDRITFTADSPLAAIVQMEIPATVADLASNALGYPWSRSFGESGSDSFLAGTVVDASTGRPLTGATVTVTATDGVASGSPPPEQTTADDGRFLLAVAPGTHDLTIARPGFSPVFRIATTTVGEGTEVFGPRLERLEASVDGAASLDADGGQIEMPSGLRLVAPAGAFAGETPVAMVSLGEQALPALLPYGWSPRGAAWLEIGGAIQIPFDLEIPLAIYPDGEAVPNGTLLTVAELDLATLQWRAIDVLPASAGRINLPIDALGGGTVSALVVLEADAGALAPPPAVIGEILGSAAVPSSDEVVAATLGFDPEVVLPAQTSDAVARYTLTTPQPSGLPLALIVQEELELLDGTILREAPYRTHLVLYRGTDGDSRSRFRLRPSIAAARQPIRFGAESVTVMRFSEESVRGNVLGPEGGVAVGDDGDRLEVATGALTEPTAIVLERQTVGDLPIAAPAGGQVDAVLRLDLADQILTAPATLSIAVDPAVPVGTQGLLLSVVEVGGGWRYRALAELAPSAIGWTTVAIDPADLPWPGVTASATLVALRLDVDHAFVRGTANRADGSLLVDGIVSSPQVDWIQRTADDGRFVLPVPVGTAEVEIFDPATGNGVTTTVETTTAGERSDADAEVRVVGPEIVTVTPQEGAVVPAGTTPQIDFSEAIDPASAGAGIRLERLSTGDFVPTAVTVQGALVTVTPQSSQGPANLVPGEGYALHIGFGVRDLEGNPLAHPRTVTFSVQVVALPSEIDPTRVTLFAPVAGQSTIVGDAGSMPADALVWAENLTSIAATESVIAGQDGSFQVGLGARVGDEILVHVLVPGGNEVVFDPGPYMSADRKGGFAGPEGATVVTADGFALTIEAGTFNYFTEVRLEPGPLDQPPRPRPEHVTTVAAFELDFGGAEAAKPIQIRLPANGAQNIVHMLIRTVESHDGPVWMLHDLLWLDGDALTTGEPPEPPPTQSLTLETPAPESPAPESPSSGPATVQSGGLTGTLIGTTSAVAGKSGQVRPPMRYKRYSAGAAFPGSYEVQAPQIDLMFVGFSFPAHALITVHNGVWEGIAAVINRAVGQYLEFDAILIPTFLNAPYDLEVRDLATGFLLFEQTFPASNIADEIVFLPPDTFGDTEPPLPIAGDPVRFFRIYPGSRPAGDLDPAIRYAYDEQNDELTVRGLAGAADPEVGVTLIDVDADGSAPQQAQTMADGSFDIAVAGPDDHRYVLAVGGIVAVDGFLDITFSEGIDLDLAEIAILRPSGTEISVPVRPAGGQETVRLDPRTGFLAGETYTLRLGAGIADPIGNAWGKTFEVEFKIDRGQVLDTYGLDRVRDVARLGSWLFLAADTDGLVILDASDPSDIKNLIPGDHGFPYPFLDPVQGVSVDPHGLVYMVGGGVQAPGELRILDPLEIDPQAVAQAASADPPDVENWYAAYRGNTQISDSLSGTGTQLPEGTPRKISILSNNHSDRWNAGQTPGNPELTLDTAAETLTFEVEGAAEEDSTVVLRNLDTGVQVPTEGDSLDRFTASIEAEVGDRLELERANGSLRHWLAGQPIVGDVESTPIKLPDPYTLGVSGMARKGRPVTLKNHSRGSFARVDADDDGNFHVELEVYPGDRLELLRNEDTLAYVATSGAGVQVVDAGRLYAQGEDEPAIRSYLIGNYSGFQDPDLTLCGNPVSDLGSAVIDVGSLLDLDNGYPFTVAGLLAFRGFALLESHVNNPGQLSFIGDGCAEVEDDTGNANANVASFEVVPDYGFDFDDDGRIEAHELRDLAVVAHRANRVVIYDISNRNQIDALGWIRLPTVPAALSIDRERRRIYVAAHGEGVYIVDFDLAPSFADHDLDGDGTDDRVLETLDIGGNTNVGIHLVAELGLGFAGGVDRGLTGMAIEEPTLRAVTESHFGLKRELERLAPLGVPTAPEHDGAGAPEQSAGFYLLAHLPGFAGESVQLDVLGLGAGGLVADGAGDETELPKVELSGTDAVVLDRLSANPWEEGFQIYRSKQLVAIADLRAARGYSRSDLEKEQCVRCEQPEDIETAPLELLSGHQVAVRFADLSRQQLAPIYGEQRLTDAELVLESVPWDVSPSVRQEPVQSPSYGSGDVAPGTLLHSGEMSTRVVDLHVRGRGLDFQMARFYRSQTVGSGPLGPGWDHIYRQRLRPLPNGDVEWYDGTGRRETFTYENDGSLAPPEGRHASLAATSAGWVMLDPRRNAIRFDLHGRLHSIADAHSHAGGDGEDGATERGNRVRFYYDQASRLETVIDSLERVMSLDYDDLGRLVSLSDFDDRVVEYAYDTAGRLEEVRLPEVATGLFEPGGRLHHGYAYTASSGGLENRLNVRDNLESLTDPRGVTWLELTYDDADGDGRNNEVTRQTWGGHDLSLVYDFNARTANVRDRRFNFWDYTHDEDGHALTVSDPLGNVTTMTYGEGGVLASVTSPLGRALDLEYPDAESAGARSLGNVVNTRITPDVRGSNGAGANACTPAQEAGCRQGGSCPCSFFAETENVFDPNNNLPIAVTDPEGHTLTLHRGETGLLESAGLPTGGAVTYEYNAFGQPTRKLSPTGTETLYAYYEEGPSRGYLQSVTVADFLTTTYEYDNRGNITAVIDPRGIRSTIAWNALDWMVEIVRGATPASDGAPAVSYRFSHLYDGNGNLREQRLPFGESGFEHTWLRATYGPLGELETAINELEPGGITRGIAHLYDENFNRVRTIDGNGNEHQFIYDARNLMTQSVLGISDDSPTGLTFEQRTYDEERNLVTRTDARGNVWLQRYDGRGRIRHLEDPLGNLETFAYDRVGNVTQTMRFDGDGNRLTQRSNEYDGLYRLVATVDWLFGEDEDVPARRTSEYDESSKLIRVVDAENRETRFGYDVAERLVSTFDALNNITAHVLDPNGNITGTTITEQLPDGGTDTVSSSFTYDTLNRPVTSTDALGNVVTTVYDGRDNPIRVIDQDGHVTFSTFDALDRRLSHVRPEGISWAYTYDGNSNLLTQTDALGNATSYTYDALDRRIETLYADQTRWLSAYDANSNLIQVTDANGTVVDLAYDASNRLLSRTAIPAPGIEGPTVETYAWDGLDRQVRSQLGDVIATQTWDSLSRMTEESVLGRTVGYAFNLTGGRTGMTYPSGLEVVADLDLIDRPMTLTADGQQTLALSYRGQSLLHRKTLGNGLEGFFDYDAARRLIGHRCEHPLGADIVDEKVAWSPRNLKVSQVRGDVAGIDRVMRHDGANRLTEIGYADIDVANNSVPSLEEVLAVGNGDSYAYDAAENLLSRAKRRAQAAAEHIDLPKDGSGRNRPGAIDGVALEWDANGNLTRKGDQRFFYDFHNRLARVSRDGVGDLATYDYDAGNRRVRKTVDGTVEEIAWAGWQELETHVAGQLTERRVFGTRLDEIIRIERDADGNGTLETVAVPVYDQVGNLVALTDASGDIVERYNYSAYGEQQILVDSTPPTIDQVRVVGDELWLELSEDVAPAMIDLARVLDRLTLTDTATSTALTIATHQPVTSGRLADRRVVITATDPPAAGTQVTLHVDAGALVDPFGNGLAADFDLTFTWPPSDTVLHDSAAATWMIAALREDRVAITFSEPVDLTTASSDITVNGSTITWHLEPDGYTLLADAPLAIGTHDLVVPTSVLDLAGQSLATALTASFEITLADSSFLIDRAVDPRRIESSAASNRYGFHGRPLDAETGLLYFRNRYFDPDMGRFVTADPMGYVDGPSMYAGFMNGPTDYSDPMGTDAIALAFPDHLITVGERRVPYLGHGAIVVFGEDGFTRYYEFGRYQGNERGLVRRVSVPNVDIAPNGLPTEESLEHLMSRISTRSGQGRRVEGAYFVTDEESTAQMVEYLEARLAQNADPDREPYNLFFNNCGTFARECLEAGGVDVPRQIDPRPASYVNELQEDAHLQVDFDPNAEETLDLHERSPAAGNRQEVLGYERLPWWKRILRDHPLEVQEDDDEEP